jgi:hypothetical protein
LSPPQAGSSSTALGRPFPYCLVFSKKLIFVSSDLYDYVMGHGSLDTIVAERTNAVLKSTTSEKLELYNRRANDLKQRDVKSMTQQGTTPQGDHQSNNTNCQRTIAPGPVSIFLLQAILDPSHPPPGLPC